MRFFRQVNFVVVKNLVFLLQRVSFVSYTFPYQTHFSCHSPTAFCNGGALLYRTCPIKTAARPEAAKYICRRPLQIIHLHSLTLYLIFDNSFRKSSDYCVFRKCYTYQSFLFPKFPKAP